MLSWRLDDHENTTVTAGGVFLVGEANGEIVGFVMARHVVDESEVIYIAVRRSQRRSGFGAALLAAALKDAEAQGVARVFLEVRESNAGAIAFYRKHGFAQVGRRRAYYRNPDNDALLFERKLTG
jgi:ribosomal-protein-alanine N-acetyltransferase